MRQKYIKTDSRYLIPSIINFIVIAVLLVTNMIEGVNQLIFCFFECGYICLIVFCAVQTRKEQKKYEEIVTNGRVSQGKVRYLEEVSYNKLIGRFGNPLAGTAYRVIVEVVDECGISYSYKSDLVYKNEIRRIPKKVKVYYYLGRNLILWEKSSIKERHKIEETKEIQEGETSRMILAYINGIFGIVAMGMLIALFYGFFFSPLSP